MKCIKCGEAIEWSRVCDDCLDAAKAADLLSTPDESRCRYCGAAKNAPGHSEFICGKRHPSYRISKILKEGLDMSTTKTKSPKPKSNKASKPAEKERKYVYSTRKTRQQLRFEVLMAILGNPTVKLRELQERFDVKSLQTIHAHVKVLKEEKLIKSRVGRHGHDITDKGKLVIDYVLVSAKGESHFYAQVRKFFGQVNNEVKHAINAEVARLDEKYKINRLGMRRWDNRLDRTVLDRKVPAKEIIMVAKKFTTSWLAASAVGLTEGAYAQRLNKIFTGAKRSIEENRQLIYGFRGAGGASAGSIQHGGSETDSDQGFAGPELAAAEPDHGDNRQGDDPVIHSSPVEFMQCVAASLNTPGK